MNPNILKVAWTIPYQPTEVDLHEVEPETLVRVRVPSLDEPSCDEPAIVHAFARRTPWGVEYEPAYVELVDRDDEPHLTLAGSVDPKARRHSVEEPLPERTEILALGVAHYWERVAVVPRLARIALDEDGESYGLTVSYALLDVAEVLDGGEPDLWAGLQRRLRTVVGADGDHSYQPFFLVCSSYH